MLMSATSIVETPTMRTVGFSTSPTIYPDGIAARIPMMSASKLANEPALELFATTAVIAKFILTFVVVLLIVAGSIYGDPGTMTIAGGIGDSGTLEYTVAPDVANAVANAARVSPTVLAVIAKPNRCQCTA